MHKSNRDQKFKRSKGRIRASLLTLHIGIPLVIVHMLSILCYMQPFVLENPGFVLLNLSAYLEFSVMSLLLVVLGGLIFSLLERIYL